MQGWNWNARHTVSNKSKLIKSYKQPWMIKMQNQAADIKKKKGGARLGAGRPTGYRAPATIKKIAIKTLQEIMQDVSASPEARAISACKLIDIDRAQP